MTKRIEKDLPAIRALDVRSISFRIKRRKNCKKKKKRGKKRKPKREKSGFLASGRGVDVEWRWNKVGFCRFDV